MRLATYQHGDETGLGVIIGSQLYDLAASPASSGTRARPPTC